MVFKPPPQKLDFHATLRRALADMGFTTGGGGVTAHSALTGLASDDHSQYHTNARGDARYALIAHSHAYDPTGTAAAAVAAHEALSDPHPGYLTIMGSRVI